MWTCPDLEFDPAIFLRQPHRHLDRPFVRRERQQEYIFLSSRRRHTIFDCDWSSDVCSSDLREKTSLTTGVASLSERTASACPHRTGCSRLVRTEGTRTGISLARPIISDALSMAQRRLRKIDRLEQELAASSGSLDDIKRIAESLNWLESRFLARPAAELMVERADPDAAQLSARLAATPVLRRERHGGLLPAGLQP